MKPSKQALKEVVLLGAYNDNAPHWVGQREALESLGHKVVTIDNRGRTPGDIMFELKLKASAPDVFIHGLADSLQENLAHTLRGSYPDAVHTWWFCDYTFYHQGQDNPRFWRDWSGVLDFGLLCTQDQIPMYEERMNIPFYFMPMAGIRVLPKTLEPIPYKDDVCFEGSMMGGIYQERTDFVKELNRHYLIKLLKHHSDSRFHQDTPSLYATSKIALSISAINTAYGYTSPRLFMIALNDGFPLVKEFPGMEDLFPGLPTFNTPGEYREMVEYYLEHEDEREALRVKITQEAKEKHTYKTRMKQIIGLCEQYSQ